MRLLLLIGALLWVPGCKDPCKLPPRPPVVEVSEGLGEPISQNTVAGYECASWVWDGCLHTFCKDELLCEWQYTGGVRVDGLDTQCPVPEGYVHVELTRKD